jgi:hypothetical protein
MNEEEIKEIINAYKEDILVNNGANADRHLLALAREIERTTRHKCVSLAYNFISQINNLNK